MSDPTEATHANPHPISGHRTPKEIAADEAGPIGQADADVAAEGAPTQKAPRSNVAIEVLRTRDNHEPGEDRG